MSASVAITAYPLSRDFRDRLEAELGHAPAYLSLPQLRRLALPKLVRTLRTFDGRTCVIPLEDSGSYPLLPVLETIAAVSNARAVEVVYSDMRRERVGRLDAVPALASLLRTSLAGRLALRTCDRELRSLLEQPRPRLPFIESNRVLYANGNLWFGVKVGGSVGHVAGVVNSFAESGMRVEYAAPTDPVLIDGRITYHHLLPPRSFGLPIELNYYRFQRSMVHELVRMLRAPTRFLYQRLSVGNYAGAVASIRAHVPLVLEYNGSEVWAARNWGSSLRYPEPATAAEAVSLHHAALVVTVSEVLRDDLLERGVEPERIVCYPNCFDPRMFDPGRFDDSDRAALRRSLGISESAIVVTFVGTFGEWHGADVLAAAIDRLVETQRDWLVERQVHFLLVGDGQKMPLVRERVGGRCCRPFVTLTGLVPQTDAPRYLAASDILVSPHVPNPDGSRFFGSPTKLFEYMAMAKPIVASDLDQIGTVLRPAVEVADLPPTDPDGAVQAHAVLTPPGDAEAIARGIAFLVEHPRWRAVLGESARSRALSRYTWSHHVAAILDGIERVRQT